MRSLVSPRLRRDIRRALVPSGMAGLGMACIAIFPAAQAAESNRAGLTDTVLVEGARITDYKTDKSSVGKLTEAVRDIPQAITTVTEQEIADRAVTTVNDTLRSVPGISLGAGETSWQGTNLFLR